MCTMATAPVKSQPLHNFSLPVLWGHRNQTNANHRYRRPSSASEQDSGDELKRSRFAFSSCSYQKQPGTGADAEECGGGDVARDEEAKPWKLRPRRATAVTKDLAEISGGAGVRSRDSPERSAAPVTKSMRLRGGGGEGHVAEKRKLWITLSREEIEEDVFSMTGGRPARRPKKRNKTVQKQVDNVFPGLYLAGVTADSFRVDENAVEKEIDGEFGVGSLSMLH